MKWRFVKIYIDPMCWNLEVQDCTGLDYFFLGSLRSLLCIKIYKNEKILVLKKNVQDLKLLLANTEAPNLLKLIFSTR